MALPAGRRGVSPSELTPDGKIKNSASPYVLPIASAETLGGVKVGTGLSIDESGLLSASSAIDIKLVEVTASWPSAGSNQKDCTSLRPNGYKLISVVWVDYSSPGTDRQWSVVPYDNGTNCGIFLNGNIARANDKFNLVFVKI